MKNRIREFPPHPYWDDILEGDVNDVANIKSILNKVYKAGVRSGCIQGREQKEQEIKAALGFGDDET